MLKPSYTVSMGLLLGWAIFMVFVVAISPAENKASVFLVSVLPPMAAYWLGANGW